MEVREFTGKTVEEALTAAAVELGIASDQLNYEVIDEGNTGFFGIIGVKPAVVKVTLQKSLLERTQDFCEELFSAMNVETKVDIDFKEEENVMDIELSGPNMSILIGRRGQTLDALQYLISLFVNKEHEEYIRIKLDSENYREKRKKTLERLARSIAYKVKKQRRPITLEPMNPYERRVIHYALQNDKYVCTKSEGEEPYRRVVVMLKKNNGR